MSAPEIKKEEQVKVREKEDKSMRQINAKMKRLVKHLANYKPKNAKAMSNFMGFNVDSRGYNTLTTSVGQSMASKNQESSSEERQKDRKSNNKRKEKPTA